MPLTMPLAMRLSVSASSSFKGSLLSKTRMFSFIWDISLIPDRMTVTPGMA